MAIAYLSIPATSAPSERVWNRAVVVLITKCSCLSEGVSSGIMFVKENLAILGKHYSELVQNMDDA